MAAGVNLQDYIDTYRGMARTSLAFYRKHQNLVDLEQERPKSIDTVRQAIRRATVTLEGRIRDLERGFYGGKRDEDDLRNILPHIRNIMNVFQVTYINASSQVEDIVQMAADPTEIFKADRHDLEFLKDYHRRMMEFVPDRINPLIEDYTNILSYVEKYCVSFFNGPDDPNMETALHYDLKQQDFMDAIHMHLDNIKVMARSYRSNGVAVKHFGLASNELARRCDCGDLPFVLIFPESVQNLLMSCKAIYKWLNEDEIYVDMLKHDIESIKDKREEVTVKLRERKEEHALLDRKIKTTAKYIKELQESLEHLRPRQNQIKKEIKTLQKEIRNKEIDMELKQQKRKEIIENAKETGRDCNKMCEQISADILEIRYSIPAVQQKIDTIKARASFITEKVDDLANKTTSLKNWRKSFEHVTTNLVLEERELKSLQTCYVRLKEILAKKNSPELTKKIYHNMPVEPRNGRFKLKKEAERRPKPDPLQKASLVVSKKIERNWKDLYRELPFYPPRGEKNIDHDVVQIVETKYRTNEIVQARESLEQWRRQHTRANLHELKETLFKMNRPDIVKDIDNKLRPKKKIISKHRLTWRRAVVKHQAVTKLIAAKPPKRSRIARMMSANKKQHQAQKEAELEERRQAKEREARLKKKLSKVPVLPKIEIRQS